MGVFNRISNLLKGYANNALDSIEDPKIVVEQAIRDLENVKKETTEAVAKCMAEEKKLEALCEEANKKVTLWHNRAANALKANNEDDAKQALEERNNFKAQSEKLKANLDEQSQQVTLLRNSLDEINDRIEEAKRRKENIVAQDRVNQANENVNKVLTKTAKNNVFEELDRMEEKVNSKKFKIESLRELEKDSSKDADFAKYDNNSVTNDDLASLKAEVFGTNVESDLDALKKEIEG
ncbi:PspA/IM30 family protein [Sedimentibacter sp. zth1]|uniref:PspA/IM30 family protein n=1 Tax=Sedimentibacter sp. zth1 TaxID=2816908 RepID=UPI001A910FC4|nr:PspA/IM30 family protein [Sedimentibacter sp. zth1]QSX05552.1 PspA/IM30 family protein [Sedimentibacter sp. zth1]